MASPNTPPFKAHIVCIQQISHWIQNLIDGLSPWCKLSTIDHDDLDKTYSQLYTLEN
jgi:hypothetical protein